MKPVIVGIAGPKRAGKNTTAAILRQCLAEVDQEILIGETSFAGPLYKMLAMFLDSDTVERLRHSDDKDTEIIEPFGCTLRHMAQTLGTEWGRSLIHPNAWVLSLKREIDIASSGHEEPIVVFVPDVRFPNEAEFVRDNGFLIHIQRPGTKTGSHASEQPLAVEDTDTVLQNTGDLTDFEQKVRSYGRSTFSDDIAAAIRTSAGAGHLLSE